LGAIFTERGAARGKEGGGGRREGGGGREITNFSFAGSNHRD
jgi:hypothetical protein